MMSDCVFCKIRDGQIPSMKVYEDERTLCIMDINPLNAGPLPRCSPRRTSPTIFDAEPADLAGGHHHGQACRDRASAPR